MILEITCHDETLDNCQIPGSESVPEWHTVPALTNDSENSGTSPELRRLPTKAASSRESILQQNLPYALSGELFGTPSVQDQSFQIPEE